jgi:hypothetical protein
MKTRIGFLAAITPLLLCGSVFSATSIGPGSLTGTWKEKEKGLYGVSTYNFQKDYEFQFVQEDGGKVNTQSGAWQLAEGICWLGDKGAKGNLIIHLGTDRCCHLAYFLGKNLVLNNVGNYASGSDVCANRVLVREK